MMAFLETLTARDVLQYGGPWLSAFGSICAVVVALMLARRRRIGKPRLTVRLVTRNRVKYIRLEVVNRGEAPITITGIGWRLGFLFYRVYLDQILDVGAGNDSLPKELMTGQLAVFYIPIVDERQSWTLKVASNFRSGPVYCWVRSVRAQAYIADQRTISAVVPLSLRRVLARDAALSRKQI